MQPINKYILVYSFFIILCVPRQAISQPAFDSVQYPQSNIPVHEKLEINCFISTQVSNPYDFDMINLYVVFERPDGQKDTVDGFFFQDYEMTEPNVVQPKGDPYWKIRYTPIITGNYQYSLHCRDTSGTAQEPEQQINCTDPEKKGFVRTRDDYYVYYDDGELFTPLGQNIAWDGFEQDFYHYRPYTDSMAKYGGNTVRLYMTPWSYGIEWTETGLGNYGARQSNAWKLDWIMQEFEARDILCSLVLCIHDELIYSNNSNNHWDHNPYNDENGGPCAEPQDFFTNSTARDFFKNKLRYVNSRWGYSPNILMYEMLSESDNFPYYKQEKANIRNWILEMAEYMKKVDINQHFTSASYAISEHDSLLWMDPAIDIAHVHVYLPFDGDLSLSLYDKLRNYQQAFDKPIIASEASLFHFADTVALKDPMGISFHNALWVSYFAGSFSSSLPWHWGAYINDMNLYPYYTAVRNFLSEDEFYYENPLPAEVYSQADSGLDVTIIPRFFSLSNKTSVDTFELQQTGRLRPLNLFLSEILYGTDPIGQNLRNPPVFKGRFAQDGAVQVHTGSFVNNALIRIKVDGETSLETIAEENAVYSVEVEAGMHYIKVENAGSEIGSYLEIDRFVFENYAPVLRVFALKTDASVRGWMQNRRYTWQHWLEQDTAPPVLQHGRIEISGMPEGTYDVSWWNTLSGKVDSVSQVEGSGDVLVLDVSQIAWDLAFKASLIVPVQKNIQAEECLHVTPNPFNNTLQLHIDARNDGQGEILIYALTGRRLLQKNIHLKSGRNQILLQETATLEAGVYLLKLNTAGEKSVIRIIKSE
ncbi:MAG: T9SS type A sorting domain-containing protein [Bacteroidota bacterium]|nr:T9SS type A sorting domain-containing protein [Bacteroidota bacterium]